LADQASAAVVALGWAIWRDLWWCARVEFIARRRTSESRRLRGSYGQRSTWRTARSNRLPMRHWVQKINFGLRMMKASNGCLNMPGTKTGFIRGEDWAEWCVYVIARHLDIHVAQILPALAGADADPCPEKSLPTTPNWFMATNCCKGPTQVMTGMRRGGTRDIQMSRSNPRWQLWTPLVTVL